MTTTPMNREQRRAAERARKARGLKRIASRNKLTSFNRQAKPVEPPTKPSTKPAVKVLRQMPADLLKLDPFRVPLPPPEEVPTAL